MEPLPETRLIVIGGAGSLFKDETRTKRVLEFIPPAMRAVPEASFEA
jgi:putative NADH-flavin reductase